MASERPRCARLAAAVLGASLSVATIAHADPSPADRETARSLMQEARNLRDKGDVPGALRRFQAADSIMHVPTTGLEVARAQVALGLLVEARDTIAGIRQTTAKPNEPAQFKEARVNADKLEASLEGRVPAITIVLHGAAEGDKPSVTVDEVPLSAEVVGLPRRVDPGHHVIVAKTEHAEGKQEIDVTEGQQKEVQVTLVATAPLPGGEEHPTQGPAAEETPALATTSHGPTALTWVGVALAGAGVAVGTVAGIVSLSKKSSLESQCTNHICGPSSYGTYDAANTMAMLSTVGFIAAGAGAGVALVSLLVGHSTASAPAARPPEALRITPWIGVGTAGLRGAF
jgi:hypothetical protein